MARIEGPIRVEHLREPLGVGTATPRLSWRSDAADDWRQAAYEIELQRGTDEPLDALVGSPDQVLVPWPFPALGSRDRVALRIRLHGEDGTAGEWSAPTALETGLLQPSDWSAAPVGGSWPEEVGTDRRPSRVRRRFHVDAPIASARLHATAHGVFEAEVNGTRVGDDVLAPGWTSYASRLRYRTYDVTDLLVEGDNAIGAWLGDGWYRGRLGFNGGYHDLYGTDLSFIGQLEITLADGTVQRVATDASWEASPSPLTSSGLYDGERYDQRLDDPAWSTPASTGGEWTPVAVGARDPGTLVAMEQPPVRRTEELAPVDVRRTGSGALLLDFGQNLVGRLRVTVDGSAGHVVTLRHAEVIQDGELYRRTLRIAAAEDSITLAGTGPVTWEPRFTIHGFRYAEITGAPDGFDASTVRALVCHTDMERTGWFASSDADLDRLHDNVLWSTRGNFVDIPTDCPQRDERLGWTGDIQVFAPTASFLYDCSGMLGSWLQDLAIEQLPDGTVPWFIPRIPGGPSWEPIEPGAVWGDAAVLTPWVLYERFGDAGVLARQYPSAKAWVDLIVSLAGPDRLWDEGFQLGDWLDPAAPPEDPADASTDRYLVATAYLAQSTLHLARTAEVLGFDDDAAHYARVAEEVRDAFRRAYVLPDGTMTSDAQTAYSLAIEFGLVAGDAAERAGDRLAELVREAGNRIATGFAGTPLVTGALTSTGHADTAYDLLLERSCPSWLYTVGMGGTTIWERWDSMLPDGTVNPGEMTSFNHYALGAVADWMHGTIAGLAPAAPGWRRIRFAPRPGGGLTHASARHLSPYGSTSSSWRIVGTEMHLTVTLPVGTTGDVVLPDGSTHAVGPGEHSFTAAVTQVLVTT
ncbi:glycoside hydrolase family 78 protein [Clavibacter sp. VKM Ac-2542]|uniref:glycoside hydrolase family 78 protein n=1 Tax=Clavibacter sp. VKM Ac-2542 TaxID=2783811 RepID=UPI00188D4C9E|nr:glycoside hydrolase family 78 protein [Clavibacter sp. VKM Ac-2542]MBF4622410.1 glycoside hydrolase family 78 protein [Clavibacter sp. VKM Ac-2542]